MSTPPPAAVDTPTATPSLTGNGRLPRNDTHSPPGTLTPSRGRWFAGLRHQLTRRTSRVLLMLIGLTLLLAALSLTVGAVYLPLPEALRALIQPEGGAGFIVQQYRLPRILCALLAGAMLGVAGILVQSALHNRLASPDVIGVSKGGGLGAVLVIMAAPVPLPGLVPVAVLAGAALAAMLLFALLQPGQGPQVVALTGIAVGAMLQAVTMLLMVSFPGDTNQAMIWITGSLYGRDMASAFPLALAAILILPALLWALRVLEVSGFDDTTIASVGHRPNRIRAGLVAVAVLLTAAAVTAVGAIGFLGLLAPNIATSLAGRRARVLLPCSTLVGGALLTLADLIGRVVAFPSEVPAGAVTAIVGAPYFLFLLWRRSRVRDSR